MTTTPLSPDLGPKMASDLKAFCNSLGFPLAGIADSMHPPHYAEFTNWLDRGFGGSMQYLEERRDAYRHPESVLAGCRSIVMLGMPYHKADSAAPRLGQAKLASYASGRVDYHDLIRDRLKQVKRWIEQRYPQASCRGVVDTAPLLEREFAWLAGLGWIGKNTLLLTRTHGSYFFLAAVLTDLNLTADRPYPLDHCGSCTACLDACPTSAFPEPHVLDATKCISYWTIEHRGAIHEEMRASIGDWIYGCDICQQVCPWNRKPNPAIDPLLQTNAHHPAFAILEVLNMSAESFRLHFNRLPMWRSKWEGMLRNAAIVAGNQRLQEATALLDRLCKESESLTVREAAHWALDRIRLGSSLDLGSIA